MKIITNIWNKDINYARSNGIQRCWRKADILPEYWNSDINNDVGSASLPECDKKMSNKDCNNICRMINIMCVKVNDINADTNIAAYALQGYFFGDSDTDGLMYMEWKEMACNWINV